MTGLRPEIGLGDLLRAVGEIQPRDPAELDRIARCLGFEAGLYALETPDYRPIPGAWNKTVRRPASRRPEPGLSPEPSGPPLHPAPEPPPDPPETILPLHISALPPEPPREVLLPAEIQSQPGLALDASRPPVPRQPLFPHRTARGLLGAAVMRTVMGVDPDVPRWVRALVQGRNLRELPRQSRRSARAGCQLLLDFSETLVPWWDDLRALMDQFHALLGEASCPVFEFAGDPNEALRWTEAGDEQRWQPVPQQPVVVATDFGQIRIPGGGPRPGLSVWRDFAALCRRRQAPLIALTPLRRERCPKALGHLMMLIHWNPATRAADIQRLIDRPQRVRP